MTNLAKELTLGFLSLHPKYMRVAFSVIDNSDFIRANLIAGFAEAVVEELCRKFKPEDGWEIRNSISAALRAGKYGEKFTGIYLRRRPWPPECYVAINAEREMAGDLLYGVWGKGTGEGDLGQRLHSALKEVGQGKFEPPYNAWWRVLPDLDGIGVRYWRQTPAIIAMHERRPDFIQHVVSLFVDVTAAVRPVLDQA